MSSKVRIDEPDRPEFPWIDPKPEDLEKEDFNLIWECIKSWDINVPEFYSGYCGSTGNHVMQILFATSKRNIQDYLPEENIIEVKDIHKINLKKNDTLVVRYKIGAQPRGMLKHFSEKFKKMYPNNNLMLLPDSVEIYKVITEENK